MTKAIRRPSDHETLASKWLEGKKRSYSLPGNDKSLRSTLDMEAAFSELLSAVDDNADNASDGEQMDLIAEDSEPRRYSASSVQVCDIWCRGW